jgi:hypothetical protein
MADILVTGEQAFFNDDVKFFKDVYIYGKLYYDFTQNPAIFNNISITGNSDFSGDVNIDGDLYVKGNASVGILTVRKRLDVGVGGTIIRAIADLEGLPFSTGKVGIGSTSPIQSLDVVGTVIITENVGIGATTIPQQRLDVGGSVKIDQYIYDSVNSPGKNGYQLARDDVGIRWIPLITEPIPGVPGIATDGVFVLDEGVPLYP